MNPEYFKTRFRTEAPFNEWPNSFAIITAYATTGETWSPERNRLADEELRKILSEKYESILRITGYSPTTYHAEPGWAVEMDLESAKEIGWRFLQDAIYFVNEGKLFVVKCSSDDALIFVDEFTNRLD